MIQTGKQVDLLLRPRDPLLFRDGRPFSPDPGGFARTLPWPLPGTVVGALRGYIGNQESVDWRDPTVRQRILDIGFLGPFRVIQQRADDPWRVYAHAPLDALPYTDDSKTKRLLHLQPRELQPHRDEGCLWPEEGENLLPLAVDQDAKPDSGLEWWSWPDVVEWLQSPQVDRLPTSSLNDLPTETRFHVGMNNVSQTAREGMLFSTRALAFAPGATGVQAHAEAIACRISLPPTFSAIDHQPSFLPLGGERRVASVEESEWKGAAELLEPPEKLVNALVGATHFRLLLLTPGIFGAGWKPAFRSEDNALTSLFVRLKLSVRAAAIGRRVAISGWDMAAGGAKANRYAVPAGSVFFVQSTTPLTTTDIGTLWATAISDQKQDCLDGYGIAVPGVWEMKEA